MAVRKSQRGPSPAHVYLDSFVRWLMDRGYAPMTTRRYMAAADRFARWAMGRCALDRVDDRVLVAYVDTLGRRPRPARRSGRSPLAADASKNFVTFPDCASITAEDLSEFTRREATRLGPTSSGLPVKCVRAFVRCLVSRGVVRAGLEGAVATIRQWKHVSVRGPSRHMRLSALVRPESVNECETPDA